MRTRGWPGRTSADELRDEDGSILPLTIFFGVLGLVLIMLVVAATSLYLEHKRLLTLADGAALAGAEAFPLDKITPETIAGDLPAPKAQLESADVYAAAADYLADLPTAGFDRLRIEQADTVDGTSATVRLAATWHPPVVSALVPDGIRIDATSVARSVFW